MAEVGKEEAEKMTKVETPKEGEELQKKDDNNTTNDEDDKKKRTSTITVYGFKPIENYPDSSPACMKLLAYLRMVDVDYDYVPISIHQMKNAPKGKVPFVTSPLLVGPAAGTDGDGDDAEKEGGRRRRKQKGAQKQQFWGDTTLIIDALIKSDPDTFDLDGHLTEQQRAVGTAFKLMFEESLYFDGVVYPRWQMSDQWSQITEPTYFGESPAIVRYVLARILARSKILRDLKGQGTGLHTDEEVLAKATKSIDAASVFLGGDDDNKRYFLGGDKVSSYDAVAFGYLSGLIQGEWTHPIAMLARSKNNLVSYVHRIKDEFFPELKEKKEEEEQVVEGKSS